MRGKKLYLFILGSFLLLLIPAYMLFSILQIGKAPARPPVIPVPTDVKKDYSRIIYLTPGKSTYDDVLKTLGSPVSETNVGGKRVLNYPTPNTSFENVVVLQDNIESFAVEHVYSSYRGVYSDYTKKLGQPDLHLYSKTEEGFDWYIFLNKGLGIESSNNEITRIVYFVPQDKSSFMGSVGGFLGLLQAPPEPQGEQIINPGL